MLEFEKENPTHTAITPSLLQIHFQPTCNKINNNWILVECLLWARYYLRARQVLTGLIVQFSSVQFSSVTQSCSTLCNPIDCSTPGLPVHHQFPELTQTHVHWVGDAIQPSHPLSSPSPPTFNLSQHQGLFQWVSSSHQVAKVLEFQLQHQSF